MWRELKFFGAQSLVGQPQPKQRLHVLYFALAAFGFGSVSLGLYFFDRITTIHVQTVEINRVWADRFNEFGTLMTLAAQVNAPGNDLFETHDIDAETGKYAGSRGAFDESARQLRTELAQNTPSARLENMLTQFDAVITAMNAMAVESDRVFAHFGRQEIEQAGSSMAAMDRQYMHVIDELNRLNVMAREQQRALLDEQTTAAEAWRRIEYVVAGLFVVMVAALTLYGLVLSRRLRQTTRQADEHLMAIAQSEARVSAVLASALDPIVTIDARGIVQTASDSLARVFGWTPAEVVGRSINVLMPEPHRTSHDTYLANYRATGQTNILGRTREFIAVRRDGSRFPIELSVSRVELPGKDEPLFMGIIHDITDRRDLEQELVRHRKNLEELVYERTRQLESTHEQLRQADRLASIGTLAAGLGHDMNNVLLPVRARLDAIDALQLPPPALEQFNAIRRSIAYLQQLSDGLHLLALDPEDAEASTNRTSLTTWWGQVGPLLVKALPRRIAFQSDIAADIPEVAAAPHRLTQAVLNLVVNAGEAIHDEGSVRVWANASPDRRLVHVGVTDTGEGMLPDVKKHAMDPFFTTKKRGLGTGLGLSLVRGVAQSAGGSVGIESEPGRGTTVTMNLPAASAIDPSFEGSANDRHVLLSISDRRAASFISAMIQAADCTPVTLNGDDPGSARVWITDPTPDALKPARRFLRADRSRRVVILGPASDEWSAIGAIPIEDPTDFTAIRRTIGQALAFVSGADS